jgi:hypothetical protein
VDFAPIQKETTDAPIFEKKTPRHLAKSQLIERHLANM